MKKNISLKTLIQLSSKLSWNHQDSLREIEDNFVNDYIISIIKDNSSDIRKFLALTTLPFCYDTMPKNHLTEELWSSMGCRKCDTVTHRSVLPTGNLRPKYMIIGDVSLLPKNQNGNDRAWSYGLSATLLRKALVRLGIYTECWFTNLLKCNTPECRKSSFKEVEKCSRYLKYEIETLKPKRIVLLGNHAFCNFEALGAKVNLDDLDYVGVKNPKEFIVNGLNSKEYAKHIQGVLK
ncbi:MAG: hypothetical protein GX163_11435 [Bacteroidetes bacterium]|nr:hypothetical protein [Bacteroidota bacterium]